MFTEIFDPTGTNDCPISGINRKVDTTNSQYTLTISKATALKEANTKLTTNQSTNGFVPVKNSLNVRNNQIQMTTI